MLHLCSGGLRTSTHVEVLIHEVFEKAGAELLATVQATSITIASSVIRMNVFIVGMIVSIGPC